MADIIEKIGKYFADQEVQMREMYVHAAAHAASSSSSAKGAINASHTAPQPPPRAETTSGKTRTRRTSLTNETEAPTATSLLRRRLSLSKETDVVPEAATGSSMARRGVDNAAWKDTSLSREVDRSDAVSHGLSATASWQESSTSLQSARSSLETLSTGRKTKAVPSAKTKKKKKKKTQKSAALSADDEKIEREKAQRRAEEGFARAQERARCIQQEKAMREKQEQLEREANAARLAEEMRKIEEIRRKGKQFAMRLRPQSAPATPQSQTPQPKLDPRHYEYDATVTQPSDALDLAAIAAASKPARSYIDGLERQMYDQMMAEMKLNGAIDGTRSREEDEWTRLQAQIQKTTDRNAIKQERVTSLVKTKETLLQEISENQAEAVALRHERHQLEEKSKREQQRMCKQREAEREIHARLRREESQRLVDEERAHSDHAAEARAKAKLRVQSRAALLKRVLHGCDIRSGTNATPNQDDTETKPESKAKVKAMVMIDAAPELAEFEEEGLVGDGAHQHVSGPDLPASPKKTMRPHILRAVEPTEGRFEWQIPSLTANEIRVALHEEYDNLSDSD